MGSANLQDVEKRILDYLNTRGPSTVEQMIQGLRLPATGQETARMSKRMSRLSRMGLVTWRFTDQSAGRKKVWDLVDVLP